jgi:hypothetical protein
MNIIRKSMMLSVWCILPFLSSCSREFEIDLVEDNSAIQFYKPGVIWNEGFSPCIIWLEVFEVSKNEKLISHLSAKTGERCLLIDKIKLSDLNAKLSGPLLSLKKGTKIRIAARDVNGTYGSSTIYLI